MKLFICYAHVDQPLIIELERIFRAGEFNVWYDKKLIVGEDWQEKVLEEIIKCDAFIYILTPESVTSKHCLWEFAQASRLGKKFIPILGRAKTKIPDVISKYQYLDISEGITNIHVAQLMVGLLMRNAVVVPYSEVPKIFQQLPSKFELE